MWTCGCSQSPAEPEVGSGVQRPVWLKSAKTSLEPRRIEAALSANENTPATTRRRAGNRGRRDISGLLAVKMGPRVPAWELPESGPESLKPSWVGGQDAAPEARPLSSALRDRQPGRDGRRAVKS